MTSLNTIRSKCQKTQDEAFEESFSYNVQRNKGFIGFIRKGKEHRTYEHLPTYYIGMKSSF